MQGRRRAMSGWRFCASCRLRMDPGSAVRPREETVGFFVSGDALLLRIPGKRTPSLHRQVGEDATSGRNIPFFDIGDRLAARIYGCKEVLHVMANGGRAVLFQRFFGLIF